MRCCGFVDGAQCPHEGVHGCARLGGTYCPACRARLAADGTWPHPPEPDRARDVAGLRVLAGLPAREPIDRTPAVRQVENPLEYRRRVWQVIGRACRSGEPFTVEQIVNVASSSPAGVDPADVAHDLLMHAMHQQHRVTLHPLDGTWQGVA